jgi:hypothetical protein
MGVSGDIANRADLRIARLQKFVHDDAVFHGQAAGRGELDIRNHTDADDDEIGREDPAVHSFDASDRAGVSQ